MLRRRHDNSKIMGDVGNDENTWQAVTLVGHYYFDKNTTRLTHVETCSLKSYKYSTVRSINFNYNWNYTIKETGDYASVQSVIP